MFCDMSIFFFCCPGVIVCVFFQTADRKRQLSHVSLFGKNVVMNVLLIFMCEVNVYVE